MSVALDTWEQPLVTQAYEGLGSHSRAEVNPLRTVSPQRLQRAYQHCASLTKTHSHTFYLASGLLPGPMRRSVLALYAFCRRTDDLVDRAIGEARTSLEAWRKHALGSDPPADDPVALAWADARARHRIPLRYAEQLIDGVGQDLTMTRYATFDDLAAYCYGVASTVGLMAMHIVGFSGPEAVLYAVRLGVALQLTNILRDVDEDWRVGRLYLPQDELAAFDLSEADIATRRIDDRWLAFIRFQVERVRCLYASSLPGISFLAPAGRFAIAAAAELYQAILEDILANGGDVFSRRAYVGQWEKLRRLPGIWWRSKTLAYESVGQRYE
jgi:phytoene synthase